MSSSLNTIHTIGHGRGPFEDFLRSLKEHDIELVCDVRSAARSRWPQYNGRVLEALLADSGVGYEWLPECGGKVAVPTEDFNRGLDRIMELAAETRIALMCSESQPLSTHSKPRANCHRVGMLAPKLRARGAHIRHILPGGRGAIEVDEASLFSIW
jgi:uncharacterized protein (DUF488 family)